MPEEDDDDVVILRFPTLLCFRPNLFSEEETEEVRLPLEDRWDDKVPPLSPGLDGGTKRWLLPPGRSSSFLRLLGLLLVSSFTSFAADKTTSVLSSLRELNAPSVELETREPAEDFSSSSAKQEELSLRSSLPRLSFDKIRVSVFCSKMYVKSPS